ncbi:MAG: threonine--tRNA ligase [Deltaproteobacteria bacterium]|nr:threonine--tRNA ligase [Deltaproteobacteria bacterium]
MVPPSPEQPGNRTALQILKEQGKLTSDTVAARVGDELVDLHSPVSNPAMVVPVVKSDLDALRVIRHSASHIMADAVQRLFPGTKVTFGPATDKGFFYDFDRPEGQFSESDLERIEAVMKQIIADNIPFRREVISKEEARKLFEGMNETYKVEHIERLEGEITIYRHGDWVDLCAGPHVLSTGCVPAVKLTSVAGAYWRGDERNPMLQRIYGTAFTSDEELQRYLDALQEAKNRDHRKLGRELDLIGFHKLAPASPFFMPRGTQVYNRLIEYLRALYSEYGYLEVISPQIYDNELFRISGHLPEYAENMFAATTVESLEESADRISKRSDFDAPSLQRELEQSLRYGVKPMNCPGHCLMYGMNRRSYRELPMRMADFGRLHRFERSGVTQGLTRVRTFSQDDGHIFCTLDQIQSEIASFLDLVNRVYKDFGFSDVRVMIATRPDERLGSDEAWDRAEEALKQAVKAKGLPFEIAEGEGVFYGPKIEFHINDALGRPWQLGTIQVDFNLPERFDLTYVGEDNQHHRPVMLHRAIFGSVERFLGVLIEHVGGAFPLWLAPEQVVLLTVSEKVNDYAREVLLQLQLQGIRAVSDFSSDKLGAKIRNARAMRYPYLAVIGQKEAEQKGVSLRSRDQNKDLGFTSLNALVDIIRREGVPFSMRNN